MTGLDESGDVDALATSVAASSRMSDFSVCVDTPQPADPRVEAAARADLPAWSGSRFDDLAHERYRAWRRQQAALILAAADAVDPLRARVDAVTPTQAWEMQICDRCGHTRDSHYDYRTFCTCENCDEFEEKSRG